jgi:LPXTG-motif cell wall-anchored protein
MFDEQLGHEYDLEFATVKFFSPVGMGAPNPYPTDFEEENGNGPNGNGPNGNGPGPNGYNGYYYTYNGYTRRYRPATMRYTPLATGAANVDLPETGTHTNAMLAGLGAAALATAGAVAAKKALKKRNNE